MPKSHATEEHQAARIEMAKVDPDWEHMGELFIAQWAHDTSGHLEKDAMYRWAHDRGVDLTLEAIEQVIHECETCTMIKQVKWVKLLCCGENSGWERERGLLIPQEKANPFVGFLLPKGQGALGG